MQGVYGGGGERRSKVEVQGVHATGPRSSVGEQICLELTIANMHRNANSLLLQLPGELRNAIYMHIIVGKVHFLLAKDGTVYESASSKEPKPYNKLRGVCRQLQAETCNFYLQTKQPYIIEGRTFIAMCEAKDPRLHNLCNIIELYGDMDLRKRPDEAILHNNILALAWNNPQATVIVRLDRLHFDTSDKRTFNGFVNFAGVVLAAFRGFRKFRYSSDVVAKWQRRKDVKELNAPNLRFFPRDEVCDMDELLHFAPLYAAREPYMMKT